MESRGHKRRKMETNICIWSLISQEPRAPQGVLTDEFVQRFDRYMDWEQLSIHYLFTIAMLRTYFHRVHWVHVLARQQFPEYFLIEMTSNFDDCWEIISKHQRLSENYIERFKDKLDWEILFDNQQSNGKFLRGHAKYLKFINFNESYDETSIKEIKSGTSPILSEFCYIYITYLISICLHIRWMN